MEPSNHLKILQNSLIFIFILIAFYFNLFAFAAEEQIKSTETTSTDNGLYGKDLTSHNAEADISFRGDQGLKRDDFYDLTGNVFIKQDNTTLTAQSGRLYYLKSSISKNSTSKLGRSGIERAIAKGNVKITKTVSPLTPEIKANSDEVELLVPEHKLILKGHAKVWRADEFIHADIINIDLDTGDISFQDPRGTFAAKKAAQSESK